MNDNIDKIKRKMQLGININIKFLVLFTFYQFTVIFEGYEILGYIVYYGLPMVFILINYKICIDLLKYFFQKKNIKIVVSLFLFYAFTCVWPLIMRTNDFSAFTNEPLSFMKQMVMQLFLIIIYIKYITKKINLDEYFHYYILSCALYVLGTIIISFIPSLKLFLVDHIKETTFVKEQISKSIYWTRYGWSGFSNFTHTIKCSISIVLIGYFLSKKQYVDKIIYYLLLLICLLGNMFYGRIGIVISGIICLFIFYNLLKTQRKYAYLCVVTTIVLAIFVFVFSLFNSNIKTWLAWIFTNFISLFQGGGVLTGSLGIVFKEMIFMPPLKTVIIGDALYTSDMGFYYMNTDVGFMRTVLFGGIPYLIIRYNLYISIMKLLNAKIENGKYFCLLVSVAFALAEIKGEVLIMFLVTLMPALILTVLKEMNEMVVQTEIE